MAEKKKIYHVDAFTSESFKDNPAGVCIINEETTTEWMQNIATETNFDFCVRCFVPSLGINEDPVTGSAHSHCALAPFLHMKTNRTDFISHQVSKRTGVLKISLKEKRVEISGQAGTMFRVTPLV
jgi:predicted PhzF superfamily epimerase YddE/YHI9